ncbi:hypothetical protein [Acuticoccus kandeliae]|uniref:hypothetical protein n=1 Tax=Acuticoccus kandeliae TaxID=2073160 RepID=UPI000D3E50DB|nr:hypothetical protein [Acuticoccus kandeliae]
METRRVLAHIGLPKSASTSLQAALAGGREALHAVGFAYPELGGRGTKDQRPLPGALAGNAADRAAVAAGIAGHAESAGLILSGETLSSSDPRALVAVLAEGPFAGAPVEALAVVRDPASWLNSMYAFRAIQFLEADHFPRFLDRQLKAGRADFETVFAAWSRAPAADFRPLPLRARGDTRSVIVRVMEAWGLAVTLPEDETRNPAPDPRTVEVARRLAGRGLARRDQAARRRARGLLMSEAKARGWARRFSGLDPQNAAEIARRTAGNDAFARRHWRAGWDEIYDMPDPATLRPATADGLPAADQGAITEVVDSLAAALALERKSVFGWLRA